MNSPSPLEQAAAKPRGFTLVELLAVIVIVVILMALLFPLLSRMRAQAKTAVCVSNLRQMGAAFRLYSADNQGVFPAVTKNGAADTSKGSVNVLGHWQVEISPYFGRELKQNIQSTVNEVDRQAQCPEFTITSTSVVSRGYGMNDKLTARGKIKGLTNSSSQSNYSYIFRVRVAEVAEPARTILVADSDGIGGDSAFVARHAERVNCLFVDGHATRHTLAESIDLKASAVSN